MLLLADCPPSPARCCSRPSSRPGRRPPTPRRPRRRPRPRFPSVTTASPLLAPGSAEIVSVTPAPALAGADDPELQRLLDKLSALSDAIGRNGQSPNVWLTQMEQGGVLFQIAERSKPEEKSNWLRMAVDSYYSAAVQSPENEIGAVNQLGRLPGRIVAEFPRSAVGVVCGLPDR